MALVRFSFVLALSARVLALVTTVWNGTQYECKCYHRDDCWPSTHEWSRLNSSVGGRLTADIPPGAVCHDTLNGPLGTVETYNAAQCANVTESFYDEQWT